MAGTCGANMDDSKKHTVSTVYTECGIDVDLAQSVWELIDALDHVNTPPKAIGIYISPGKDGKYYVTFRPYKMGDEQEDETLVAAMAVNPTEESDVELGDPDLRKAMQFMYFYQSVYSQTQRYELGM